MSDEDMSDKEWTELLAKVDQLVEGVNSLQRDLKDWKDELTEEFAELTGILVEHFQQVIDKHLFNKEVEDYYNGETIDSPPSEEEYESTETYGQTENQSSKDTTTQSDQSVATYESRGMSEGLTEELTADIETEVD